MLPFTFLRRGMLLYLCPFSYYASAANGSSDLYILAILHLSEYTQHGISHSVCAKHDNVIGCDACKMQTPVNVLCSCRRVIYFCMILLQSIILKKLRTFLEYNKVPDLNGQGIRKNEFNRERFDYNEERGW